MRRVYRLSCSISRSDLTRTVWWGGAENGRYANPQDGSNISYRPLIFPIVSYRPDMGKKTAEEIAAGLRPKFPVFTKEELLTDMEYGGTLLSRAVINVNVAFQELGKR